MSTRTDPTLARGYSRKADLPGYVAACAYSLSVSSGHGLPPDLGAAVSAALFPKPTATTSRCANGRLILEGEHGPPVVSHLGLVAGCLRSRKRNTPRSPRAERRAASRIIACFESIARRAVTATTSGTAAFRPRAELIQTPRTAPRRRVVGALAMANTHFIGQRVDPPQPRDPPRCAGRPFFCRTVGGEMDKRRSWLPCVLKVAQPSLEAYPSRAPACATES